MPIDLLPSSAVTIGGKSLDNIGKFLRSLPRPVIGRVTRGRLILDCRCLEQADEEGFIVQLLEAGNTV
jgi:L-seryl-tRNA(Ser) seleniumtransferase